MLVPSMLNMAPERSARVREARGATVKTITLPADHVEFSEVAHLIASALYPLCEDSTDGEMFTHGCARINLEAELIKAVKAGTLPVKDPLTFGPHTFPMGHALQTSLVAANDLRDFLAGRGLVVEVAESQPAPVVTNGKKWTPEKLVELKDYRECHTERETAKKFGISGARIRQLLSTPGCPQKKPYSVFTHLIE